ncbi:MAG: bacillithiol biosynthesis deacetylase BshB1 [Cytophagales bacterium]
MDKIDILAVGAHPDDVELSCAGTLLKQKSLGYTTGIIDLSEGELGTRGTVHTRREEAKRASEILKLDIRENLKLPDGYINPFNNEQLLVLIDAIRKYKPSIVLTNAIEDRHPDHGNACQLIERACFLSGLPKIESNHPSWRPKHVFNYIQDRYVKPHFVVDITSFWNLKIESIRAYKTQFYDPESKEPNTYISSPRFLDYVEARNRDFGRFCNAEYAEGFTSKSVIGIQNLMTDLT